MELAKVTSKGQVTIPIEIRKKLGIKNGDKILFVEESGRIYMMNSAIRQLCRFKISHFHPQQNTASSLWKNVPSCFRHPLMTGWKN